jgi:hypothetical protein
MRSMGISPAILTPLPVHYTGGYPTIVNEIFDALVASLGEFPQFLD